MDKHLKHIVETSELLTQSEIQNYLSNNALTKEERFRIELKINNNPANQELLDAYKEMPDLFDDFESFKSSSGNNGIRWFIYLASLISIVAIAFFSWNFEPEAQAIDQKDINNLESTLIQKPEKQLPNKESQQKVKQDDMVDKPLKFVRDSVKVEKLKRDYMMKYKWKEQCEKLVDRFFDMVYGVQEYGTRFFDMVHGQ